MPPAAPAELEGSDRRGPALVIQVRDVAALVALLTVFDTMAKWAFSAC